MVIDPPTKSWLTLVVRTWKQLYKAASVEAIASPVWTIFTAEVRLTESARILPGCSHIGRDVMSTLPTKGQHNSCHRLLNTRQYAQKVGSPHIMLSLALTAEPRQRTPFALTTPTQTRSTLGLLLQQLRCPLGKSTGRATEHILHCYTAAVDLRATKMSLKRRF